jgi:hypothetical protein
VAYADIVGQQAVEFERRMHAAGVVFRAEPLAAGWRVIMTLRTGKVIRKAAIQLSSALWQCGAEAGLTEGLTLAASSSEVGRK